MSILELKQVSLQRGGRPVLDTISFSVEHGDILAIIGPSGSGKSSLLRTVNRLETIDSGKIYYHEQPITTLSVTKLRCQIGMIFQKTAVFDGTVADNIAMGPTLHGETLSRDRILELMQLANLEPDLVDRDARTLSGGQEQRLAIARSLANEPDILLLDEPTSALDPVATHKVEASLLHLREALNLTMLWVSHSIEQTRRIADRVLLLEAGRIKGLDRTSALLHPETGDAWALAFASGDLEEA